MPNSAPTSTPQTTSQKETLTVEHIGKRYFRRWVVQDISLKLSSGEIVGLLGPNGAGKTTAFYTIVGLVKPSRGKVFLNNNTITKLPIHKRAKLGIGYLPQEASIFRKLSVENNILSILETRKDLNHSEKLEALEELLNEFHLTHIRKSQGISLSGGERRRTEIARALAANPKFILLDEPFAGVDPISVIDIKRIILQLKSKNIGILITDHNVRDTLDICERAYICNAGKILTEGSAEDILSHEDVKRVYLGENFKI